MHVGLYYVNKYYYYQLKASENLEVSFYFLLQVVAMNFNILCERVKSDFS